MKKMLAVASLIFLVTNCLGKEFELPFKVGEMLIYTVEKKIFNETITLGKATLKLKRTTFVRGVECYCFIFDVKSDIQIGSEDNTILKISVHNQANSYSSVKDFTTCKIERYIDEKYPGREKKVEKTTIEIADNTVFYSNGSKIEMHTWTEIRDNLTMVYWLRSLENLEKQNSISTNSLAENQKEIYKLSIMNRGIEKVKVPLGEFNCTKLEYLLLETKLFDIDENMFVWLSQDERRIPIMMYTEGLIFKLEKIRK
jgi:hypothetical protein